MVLLQLICIHDGAVGVMDLGVMLLWSKLCCSDTCQISTQYGSGLGGAAFLLPGFAIS